MPVMPMQKWTAGFVFSRTLTVPAECALFLLPVEKVQERRKLGGQPRIGLAKLRAAVDGDDITHGVGRNTALCRLTGIASGGRQPLQFLRRCLWQIGSIDLQGRAALEGNLTAMFREFDFHRRTPSGTGGRKGALISYL